MLAVALTMLFRSHNVLMAGGILAVFAMREVLWHSRGDVRIFLIGLFFGCSIEIAGVALGVWMYTDPTFLGIPLWLPAAWGISAVVLMHVGQAIGGAGRPVLDDVKDRGRCSIADRT